MTKNTSQKNIDTILEILKNEINGEISRALEKMDEDYSMTWVYKRKDGILFPTITAKHIKDAMKEVYVIKDRNYDIKNIIANNNIVMAELIESYPDPETGKIYRTPMVIVWELKNGKIKNGRHYCDPQLSYLDLTEEDIKKIYRK